MLTILQYLNKIYKNCLFFILEVSLFVIDFIQIFDPSSSLGLRASPWHPTHGVNVYPSLTQNNKYEIVYTKGSITHHMWTNHYGPPIDNIQIVTNESIAIILINILWIYTNRNSFSLSLTLINRFFLFKNIVCK
jgi:hypothetical protein